MDPAEVGIRWLDPAKTNFVQALRRVDGKVKPNAKRAAASEQTATIHGRRPRGGGQQLQFALLVLNFGSHECLHVRQTVRPDLTVSCLTGNVHQAQSVEFQQRLVGR